MIIMIFNCAVVFNLPVVFELSHKSGSAQEGPEDINYVGFIAKLNHCNES